MSVSIYLEEMVLLSAIGGILAIDEKAGWQSLLDQPVISSAIIGLVFGDFTAGVAVGVVLQLVWLSVLPMRGVRKPDAVAGAIVGAGTACLLIKHTGDPRFMFIVSLGSVLGLIAGELAGSTGRRIHRFRERGLGRVESTGELSRRLLFYFFYSMCFIFVAEAVQILVMLPVSILLAEWISGAVGASFASGAEAWVDIVPALGAGAIIQMYWHKQHNRYLVLCAGITLVLLWFR